MCTSQYKCYFLMSFCVVLDVSVGHKANMYFPNYPINFGSFLPQTVNSWGANKSLHHSHFAMANISPFTRYLVHCNVSMVTFVYSLNWMREPQLSLPIHNLYSRSGMDCSYPCQYRQACLLTTAAVKRTICWIHVNLGLI